MSVRVEKSRDGASRGFQPSRREPSHTNAKLSNMALLHLFPIYHSPLCGPGICRAGEGISTAYEKLDQRQFISL